MSLPENAREIVNTIHLEKFAKFKDLSLMEVFLTGHTWSLEKIEKNRHKFPEILKFFLVWDYKDGKGCLTDMFPGIYNRKEIQNARSKASFLKRVLIDRKRLTFDYEPTVEELEELSYEAYNLVSILYVIKCYVVSHGLDAIYDGILPVTTPVKIYHNMSCGQHTKFVREVQSLYNLKGIVFSTQEINTLIWHLGQLKEIEMKKEVKTFFGKTYLDILKDVTQLQHPKNITDYIVSLSESTNTKE